MERPVQSLHVRPVGLRQARRSGHESEVHALLRPLRKSSEQGPNRRLIDCRRLSARRVIGYSPAFALSLCFASGDLRTLIDLHPRVEHMLLVELTRNPQSEIAWVSGKRCRRRWHVHKQQDDPDDRKQSCRHQSDNPNPIRCLQPRRRC